MTKEVKLWKDQKASERDMRRKWLFDMRMSGLSCSECARRAQIDRAILIRMFKTHDVPLPYARHIPGEQE